MLMKCEWSDHDDVFDAVATALLEIDDSDVRVDARDEPDGYGSRGYIALRTPDGRRFRLQLWEEV